MIIKLITIRACFKAFVNFFDNIKQIIDIIRLIIQDIHTANTDNKWILPIENNMIAMRAPMIIAPHDSHAHFKFLLFLCITFKLTCRKRAAFLVGCSALLSFYFKMYFLNFAAILSAFIIKSKISFFTFWNSLNSFRVFSFKFSKSIFLANLF